MKSNERERPIQILVFSKVQEVRLGVHKGLSDASVD